MKLNKECIRDLLLYLEDNLVLTMTINASSIVIAKYTTDDIIYTSLRLAEANFINITNSRVTTGRPIVFISSITIDGHEFLDNVRDPDVWRKTKSATSKVASVSINILSQVASSILTTIALKG